METGDILLFKSITCCACCVSFFTRRTVNHVGIVLKNIEIDGKVLDGTYVLESSFEFVSDVYGRKFPLGVQITDLDALRNSYVNISYRHLNILRGQDFYDKIKNLVRVVRDAPYDFKLSTWAALTKTVIGDAVDDAKNIFRSLSVKKLDEKSLQTQLEAIEETKKSAFTCSALVAYMLAQLKLLSFDDFDDGWNSVTPRFFADLKCDWLSKPKKI